MDTATSTALAMEKPQQHLALHSLTMGQSADRVLQSNAISHLSACRVTQPLPSRPPTSVRLTMETTRLVGAIHRYVISTSRSQFSPELLSTEQASSLFFSEGKQKSQQPSTRSMTSSC